MVRHMLVGPGKLIPVPIVLGVLSAMLSGCAADSNPAPEVTVRDSLGIRIVSHGVLSDIPTLHVRQRPIFRTGWYDDEPTFETIRGGGLRSDGSVAVFDDEGKALYLIDQRGRSVTKVGRDGEGPGEFRSGEAVEILSGDSILVYDYMLHRLSLFDAAGSFVDSNRWTNSGVVSSKPTAVTVSGRIAWVPNGHSSRSGAEGRSWLFGPLLTSSPLGLNVDTVALLPVIELRFENGRRVSDPFGPYGATEGYADGFVSARNDVPELRWTSQDGAVRQIARWEASLTTVDDEVWGRYEAAYLERMGSIPERGTDLQMQAGLRDARSAASSTLPLFRYLHAASDGSVWLSEYTMFGMPAESFLMFGVDGAAVARVDFPQPIQILDIRDGRVLGVETDEWGVQAVVVYAVPM